MDRQDYNRAENAVDKAKWTVNDYAERAKDYIREQRDRNTEPTEEGWMERAKENVADAWDSTKDAISEAWEKTKNWTEDAWDKTKDTANNLANDARDKVEDVKTEWKNSTN